jgi:DNA processing protein
LAAGKSAAVLACGLDHPYPRGNRHLFEALVSSGGVVSEYPPGTGALPFRFPARNRIVTGSARALIIVEAAERSGSLVSARLAADQGRELFAVPGNVDSPVSKGTNALLRDGCRPLLDVKDVEDVLAVVGLARAGAQATRAAYIGDPDAERILSVLESEPAHFDDLVEACRLDGPRVLELLTTLELAGLAERSAGGLFALAKGAVFTRERPRPQRTA